MNKAATFSLPESILKLIEDVRRKRRDPTRSDTVRVLLLQALGAMSYISNSEKKALGIRSTATSKLASNTPRSARRSRDSRVLHSSQEA